MQHGVTAAQSAYLIGYFESVSFAVLRSQMQLEALAALDRNHLHLSAKYPKVSTIVIAEEGMALPSQPLREEAARLMRLRAGSQLTSCSVLEGAGFVAAAARGVLTAIQVLSSHAYPLHVTRTAEDAAAWTATKSGHSRSWGAQLAACIASSREEALSAQRG